MKKSLPLALITLFSSCLLLAGCSDSDWDHALNYTGLRGSVEEPEAPPPARAAMSSPPAETAAVAEPANTDFCRAVAMQDAGENGFDQATQQRVYARSYAQCMMLNAR